LSFDEEKLDTLEPGKLADFADFAVLDRDYLACPAEEIRKIEVVKTVMGGEVVYEK
jgi:predicted amidohydrolase YtcJ